MKYLAIYLAIINLAAFLLCGIDKRRAIKRQWRVPEATLIFCAILGGSAGMIFGMQCFRHKTNHAKFAIGVPLILLAQIALAIYFYRA